MGKSTIQQNSKSFLAGQPQLVADFQARLPGKRGRPDFLVGGEKHRIARIGRAGAASFESASSDRNFAIGPLPVVRPPFLLENDIAQTCGAFAARPFVHPVEPGCAVGLPRPARESPALRPCP